MSARTIAVAGDVSVDWLLPSSAGERRAPVDFIWMWGGAYACRAISSSGGAASHAKILRAAAQAAGLTGVTVVGPEVPVEALASPYQRSYTSTYARIQRFPRELGSQGENTAWRIAEFLGSDPSPAAPVAEQGPAPERIDTLLLVDHAQGYRDRPAGLAPLLNAKPRAIVWQTGAPHTGSTLADLLLSEHRDSLTVITSSDELRKSGHQVGYALSWEQLAEEVLGAVAADVISQAQRVIVVIGAVGALIVEREGVNVLVFDSRSQEGDWGKRYPGVGAAYGRCIDAAVALGLTGAGEPALVDAVKRGLAGARAAHLCGFVVDLSRDVFAEPFPLEAVAAALARDSDEFASVVFRPAGASILAQTYSEQAMVDVAAATAIAGSSSLPPGIPVETVGSWVSVDRIEIESLRSVRNIMAEYVEQRAHGDRGKQPLSVAVFGPPGAGKTFAVRQLATVILPEQLRTLEFNLSQLRAESDLHSALHRVRDVALEGDLPLVFWDEFDAPCQGEPLGWLQHFLAPMEDGRFRDRGGFHPVGPAIFVFAGGTATRFADFVVYSDERAERAAKKPDFISRLGGYVDVTGPNPQDAADVAWPLRRALLLRSLVAQRAPQMMTPGGTGSQLEIDEGVLRAFLLVGEYIHGARSMAAIVRMSALSGKPRFERASLPARQQLGLHVDADQFLALVRG
jgi:hypothetical protein